MKKDIRWGIIGPGKIADKFAAALQYTEGSVVYAVAARDKERALAFATKYNAAVSYDNYEALAADTNVDIIYIATPHAFHCEHTLLCLRHQKAVLCEKPLSLNYQQSQQMVQVAQQQDVFLMEGMWTRFMPAINKVKELVDNGEIGSIQHIAADFGFNAPYDPQSRLYNLGLGGGSLLDVGIYPVFLVTFLLGQPTGIQSTSKLAPSGADLYCNVLLQYAGGQTANIFSAINLQTAITATITGTKGRIHIHSPWFKAHQLTIELNNGEARTLSFPLELNGFEYEIREVTDCMNKGFRECPAMPLDFSLDMSRIMDTIKEQAGIVY